MALSLMLFMYVSLNASLEKICMQCSFDSCGPFPRADDPTAVSRRAEHAEPKRPSQRGPCEQKTTEFERAFFF
eukprot:6495537-Pyramimonas_sp.AAC.1